MQEHWRTVRIFLIVASILLLLAIPSWWPYGFYQFLRFAVTATAIYSAYVGYNVGLRTLTIILGIIAILFNPLIPIHLTKEIWTPIDLIVAIFFWVTILIIRRKLREGNADNG